MALAFPAQAHSPVDPAAIEEQHPTGHLRDHADLTWPPQPRGITDAVLLSEPGAQELAAAARERAVAIRERMAIQRSAVRKALGARFVRSAFVDDEDKSGGVSSSRLVYFSHSNNATVEVVMTGQRVSEVRRIPASECQPEITEEEAAQAEAIARAYFAQQGIGPVAQLEGFSILAYRPRGRGFFDTRVLYVSFHRDSDAPPQYVAWVDLTRQRVLRARAEPQ